MEPHSFPPSSLRRSKPQSFHPRYSPYVLHLAMRIQGFRTLWLSTAIHDLTPKLCRSYVAEAPIYAHIARSHWIKQHLKTIDRS